MNNAAILPVAYLAPLPHYIAMLSHTESRWDIYEHFHKQFFYNRCMIYGANGPLKLIIPLHKRHEKTPLKDIKIKHDEPWQTLHWRSFEASYRRSPFFEYFEDELYPLYQDYQPELLVEWNKKLFETANKLLGIKINLGYTSEYCKSYENSDDYRELASPAIMEQKTSNPVKYTQVFEEKHGFLPNLSIIDLLFCEGPHGREILMNR